ncbi:MAG: HAD family hydrolase [Proteobacteria bacterium]|nr:HAD family hydrolase [Pseudomonadota bacterium]
MSQMAPLLPPKALLFDLDGTLIEPEWEYFLSEATRLFASLGFPPPSAEAMRRSQARGSLFELFPHERRDELMRLFWQDYREEAYPHPRPLTGALDTLQTLHAEGYRMGVVTARGHSPQQIRELMAPTGLLPFLNPIFSQGQNAPAAANKTNLILEILAHYGIEPHEAIIIGDSPVDISSGQACGLQSTVAVLSGGYEFDYLESCNPDYILGDICELPALLRSRA